jgi:hypothetical protein
MAALLSDNLVLRHTMALERVQKDPIPSGNTDQEPGFLDTLLG